MSRVSSLHRLQQFDLKIDRATARLEEIRAILEGSEALARSRQKLAEAENHLRAARSAHKDAELAVEGQRTKIEQTEQKLYGGTVKNPKELQDLQQEAEALMRYLSTLEDRLLEAMVKLEEAEEEERAARDELERTEQELAREHNALKAEQQELEAEVARLSEERAVAAASTQSDDLQTYEELRRRLGGLAVAMVESGSCSACGLTISASLLQVIRRADDLSRCTQCGRILYAG